MEDDDWCAGVILEVAEDLVVRLVSLVVVRERRVPLLHGDGLEKCD